MSRVVRACLLVLLCNFLLACEDDVDFDKNSRTVDVRVDNAELISLAMLQSQFFAHYYSPFYNFLDASDIPAGAVFDGFEYSYLCAVQGSVIMSFSRAATAAHQRGDLLSVEYFDCDEGKGLIYNGALSAVYDEIVGLNDRFVELNTELCVDNVTADLGGAVTRIDVSGTSVSFNPFENSLVVAVDGVQTTNQIFRNEKAVVINERSDTEMTSLAGDQVFSVENMEATEVACQFYERTLRATLRDFSVEKPADELVFTYNGVVSLREGTEDFNSYVREISESAYTLRVQQGNSLDSYTMVANSVSRSEDETLRVYSYEFGGDVKSRFGSVTMDDEPALTGSFNDDYPKSGEMNILARGDEQIAVKPDGLALTLEVDVDGDSDGNQIPDVDETISTSWQMLLDRDFIEAEL